MPVIPQLILHSQLGFTKFRFRVHHSKLSSESLESLDSRDSILKTFENQISNIEDQVLSFKTKVSSQEMIYNELD